jgi:hypothetical protein
MIVPNEIVDGRDMLEKIGRVMEEEEEAVAAAREAADDGLITEIEKLVKEKGWSADERRTYLDKLHEGPELPLFADSADEMDPRLIEALAHLKYDGEEPEDLAEQSKIDGNKNFKTAAARKRKMYYREAVKHYTEGCLHCLKALEKKDMPPEKIQEVNELFSALLSNRAACNLVLKNFGSVKRDCGDAIRFVPTNVKAHFRKAKACLELRQYEDGLVVVEAGLNLEPDNADMIKLKAKLEEELTERKRREELVRVKEEKEMDASRALFDMCISRGALLGPGIAADGYQQQASDKLPTVDESDATGAMTWPTYFLYPQYRQSDFIEAFAEDDFLADHLATVFPVEEGPAAWDEKFEYKCDEMEVYLQLNAMPAFKLRNEWAEWVRLKRGARGEVPGLPAEQAGKTLRDLEQNTKIHEEDQVWLRLNPGISMSQILRLDEHVVSGGVVLLYMYPRKSIAHQEFIKAHGKRVRELDIKAVRAMPKKE